MGRDKESNESGSITGGLGGRVTSVFPERELKIFSVLETEFSTMSYMNTATTAFFSAGSFFLNMSLNAPRSLGLFLASCAFFISGGAALYFRSQIAKKIKEQSKMSNSTKKYKK